MASSNLITKTLIVGLGNLLLRDDGVGVHVIRALEKNPPEGAILADVGTSVLNALGLFASASKIIAIDAMQGGRVPGSLYLCNLDGIMQLPTQSSLHQLSLVGALKLLPASEQQKEIIIIGVEPEIIEYGMDLSEPVRNAIPEVVKKISHLLIE